MHQLVRWTEPFSVMRKFKTKRKLQFLSDDFIAHAIASMQGVYRNSAYSWIRLPPETVFADHKYCHWDPVRLQVGMTSLQVMQLFLNGADLHAYI